MAFNPAHDALVLYSLDEVAVTESADGETPATLPAAPSSTAILGYTNLPQTSRGLGNSKGFALGMQGAAYNKRGPVKPTIDLTIRPGSVAALQNFFPVAATGKLRSLCLYVVVKGQYTDVYRFCKPNSLTFNFGSGEGGGELSIAAQMFATAYQRMAAITWTPADVKALGTPLMWHDVRKFSITSQAGVATNYRRSLMNLNAKVDYALEYKNERPDFGDNSPLARTPYELLEHHTTVTGSVGLHERLDEALFTGAKNAQDWQDIIIRCRDAAANKGFTLTMADCFPADETQGGGESNSEITHTVPFGADTMEFALINPAA